MSDSPSWFHREVLQALPGDITFAVIKPGVPPEQVSQIVNLARRRGLTLRNATTITFSAEDVRALYWAHVGKEFYGRNADYMMSGESILLALGGPEAVTVWRKELMPEIRAKWPNSNPEARHKNIVHGSDSEENAFRELQYFFG